MIALPAKTRVKAERFTAYDMSRWSGKAGVGCMVALLMGCAGMGSENPSFDVSVSEAREALREMEAEPGELERPVVVLAGLFDPGVASWNLARQLRNLTGDERIVSVAFPVAWNFDACRERAIAAVQDAFPSEDARWTTEVDVVGISMGGLVARYAAKEREDQDEPERRLRIARLFTISTPHQGAALAAAPSPDPRQRAMRKDSDFLKELNDRYTDTGYELYPYVRLGDRMVGAENAAPPGEVPWWVPARFLQPDHLTASLDPRIVADIARRLRGESPFTSEPREPLP